MKLPNADRAHVHREKITEYLLSIAHPDGRSKARFFSEFGFSLENWEILAEALRKHGTGYPIVKAVESDFGMRYNVEGELETPDGRRPRVRTVWILSRVSEPPRLITAYPC